jgi:hypothetical protein
VSAPISSGRPAAKPAASRSSRSSWRREELHGDVPRARNLEDAGRPVIAVEGEVAIRIVVFSQRMSCRRHAATVRSRYSGVATRWGCWELTNANRARPQHRLRDPLEVGGIRSRGAAGPRAGSAPASRSRRDRPGSPARARWSRRPGFTTACGRWESPSLRPDQRKGLDDEVERMPNRRSTHRLAAARNAGSPAEAVLAVGGSPTSHASPRQPPPAAGVVVAS